MSTELVCDHCRKRLEPGIGTLDWWEVSNREQPVELDFCSAACLAAYFTVRLPAERINSVRAAT